MADNKNIDESAQKRKKARIEKNIKDLSFEILNFSKFQNFNLAEFKRSDSYKKYTSLETYIPETNKSVGADVARLLLGRFKEKKRRVALKDENGEALRDSEGNRVLVDQSDNSFKARLKRSGLTSFGRYISDDKQGIGYDILRTFAGRFSDDFNKKKKSLERNEKKLSTLDGGKPSSSPSQNESDGRGANAPSVIGINPKDTETIVSSIKDSSDKILDSTDEIVDISKRSLSVEKKLLALSTKTGDLALEEAPERKKVLETMGNALKGFQKSVDKKGATELEKELEKKKTFEGIGVALKDIQKSVKNTVNLATKSVGGAGGGGEGGVLDDIADAANILSFGKGILGKVGGAFGSIFKKVKGFGASTAGMLKHGAKVGTNKTLPLLHKVTDPVKSVGAKVTSKVAPKANAVKETVKTTAKNVSEKANAVKETVKTASTNALEKGKAIGTNVLDKGKGLLEKGKSAAINIPEEKAVGLAKGFAKKASFIGAGITAATAIYDINKASDEIDEKVKEGIISKEDANRAKTNSAIEIGARGAGTAVGGIAGMKGGAALGGAIGTLIFPGLGTAVGSALGGLVGSFAGAELGNWLGGTVGDSMTDEVKEKGSFEERYAELKERRREVSLSSARERQKEFLLTRESFSKKLAELEKSGAIKRTGVNEKGGIIYDNQELVNKVWRESSKEVQEELRRRKKEYYKDEEDFRKELREANPELYKSYYGNDRSAVGGGGTNLDGTLTSTPKKNKEGDKGKASDNTPPKTESKKEGVKEKKSYEERLKDIKAEKLKWAHFDTQDLKEELFQKKLSNLNKPENLEKFKKLSAETGQDYHLLLSKEATRLSYQAAKEAYDFRESKLKEVKDARKALIEEIRVGDPELYASIQKKDAERRENAKKFSGDGSMLIGAIGADPLVTPKTDKSSDNTPPKKDTGKNSTPKTESKKEGVKENKPKAETEPKKDAVGVKGDKPKIEPKKDEVKEKGSFEERLKGIQESYKKVSDGKENRRRVGDELYTKKIAELVKSGDIKPLGKDEDGNIIYDNQELVNKARQDATKEAPKELRRQRRQLHEDENNLLKEIAKDDIKLFNRIWDEKERKAVEGLYYDGNGPKRWVSDDNTNKAKEPLSTITSNNISPSNKNQESEKMVKESDRANFNEKQRQAESGKTSENVINNVHQTNVNNQTVQTRQLKPRSEQSIHDRLSPFYY